MPWVSSAIYAVVLLAGGYAGLVGLGDTTPVKFIGGLVALFTLELVERARYPAGTPARLAAALIGGRLALFVLVASADGSGLSRVLFVLVPFMAYLAFGRVAGMTLAVVVVAIVVAGYQARIPHWYGELEPVSDLLMFCLGLVLAIAMASVAVREQRGRTRLEESHARLREYADQVAELSAAAERNRLARDIHDGLGHHLTAITLLLEKAATFRDRDATAADQSIEDARRSARRALDEVRSSVRALRVDTAPFRLGPALRTLVREVDDGMSITLDCSGDEHRYDSEALVALYRAAQEALTNALRHAGATEVSVSLDCGPTQARMVIADNGRGLPPQRDGWGLLGMRERMQLVGGVVAFDNGLDAGTRITATIPCRTLP